MHSETWREAHHEGRPRCSGTKAHRRGQWRRQRGAALATRRAHATGRSAWLAEDSTRHPPGSSPANAHADPGALECGELGSGRGHDP